MERSLGITGSKGMQIFNFTRYLSSCFPNDWTDYLSLSVCEVFHFFFLPILEIVRFLIVPKLMNMKKIYLVDPFIHLFICFYLITIEIDYLFTFLGHLGFHFYLLPVYLLYPFSNGLSFSYWYVGVLKSYAY